MSFKFHFENYPLTILAFLHFYLNPNVKMTPHIVRNTQLAKNISKHQYYENPTILKQKDI